MSSCDFTVQAEESTPLMTDTPLPSRRRSPTLAEALIWGVLFGLTYAQSPLYTSNQNQYFLHGAAQAGVGFLKDDWLANTADPTPVFTFLVRLTLQFLDEKLFYLFYFLLFAVYLYSLVGIADWAFDIRRSKPRTLLFLALTFALHSAALRFSLAHGISWDWEYFFDAGIGGQRLLGPVLQPSVFGVFLLLSIERFLRGETTQAVLAAVLAATVHPTYLLSAAALTLTYAGVIAFERRDVRRGLGIAALALLAVSPILIYVVSSFTASSAETRATAQDILVTFRIPTHAVPAEWLGETTLGKALLVLGAALAVRRTRLSPIVLVSTGIAAALTAVQIALGSNTLALLFPWRLSTYLVPLAVAILSAWAVSRLADHFQTRIDKHPRLIPGASTVAMGLLVTVGALGSALELNAKRHAPEQKLYGFVRDNLEAGQSYLIPARMQDFRLETGAPAFADFKSIPYRGYEVLEWYNRIQLLDRFYRRRPKAIKCRFLSRFSETYAVTHIVLEEDQFGLTCSGLEELYNDGLYGVYALELEP